MRAIDRRGVGGGTPGRCVGSEADERSQPIGRAEESIGGFAHADHDSAGDAATRSLKLIVGRHAIVRHAVVVVDKVARCVVVFVQMRRDCFPDQRHAIACLLYTSPSPRD